MRPLCGGSDLMVTMTLLVCMLAQAVYEVRARESLSDEHTISGRNVSIADDNKHSTTESLSSNHFTDVASRYRKRSMTYKSNKWGYEIPVVFDSSYSDPYDRDLVRRVVKFINSRTCLNLVDETEKWSADEPHWFTEHGYDWDSAIIVKMSKGCSTQGYGPSDGKNVIAWTCKDTDTILHELFHSLGVTHMQEAHNAPSYISTFVSAIIPQLRYTYSQSDPLVYTKYYDPSSTTQYYSRGFGLTGDDTYVCVRDDLCTTDDTAAFENVIFEEINERYNCSGVYCSHIHKECSPGFLTLINHTCGCVCPPEFDPNMDCKTLIDKADSSLEWPIPLTVIAGDNRPNCPKGFQSNGWVSLCGRKRSRNNLDIAPFEQDGAAIHIPLCSKTSPTDNVEWNAVPIGGRYCFIQAEGEPCGGLFRESILTLESTCDIETYGSIGDITINGRTITVNMCCNFIDRDNYPVALPSDTPFRMFFKGICPEILGMRSYEEVLEIFSLSSNITGENGNPDINTGDKTQLRMCYFQPAVYGCNRYVSLNEKSRTSTILTPGYPSNRPPNSKCIYCFNAPDESKLRVTFNHFDLSKDDRLRVKSFHKWMAPFRIDNQDPPYQFVTERNFLCLEFWASFRKGKESGLNFTVDLLPGSESCYNVSQNGMDYLGTTNISETYEACLPWADTLDCVDSPINALESLTGYFESNFCRNPGGTLLQPWCYVYRNETSCIKRYCDVCNTMVPVDKLNTKVCTDAIKETPTFCESAIQRFACFKSCKMTQAPARPTESAKCGKLPSLKNSLIAEPIKSSYRVGERVYAKCTGAQPDTNSNVMMLCTMKGWVRPSTACTACPEGWILIDNRCILFNNEPRSRTEAETFCRRFGRGGTLMQVKSREDQQLLRQLRNNQNSRYSHTWISGFKCEPPSAWCYSNSSTRMNFFNWGSGADTDNPTRRIIFVYREQSSSHRDGLWYTEKVGTLEKLATACQIDSKEQYTSKDLYPTCQEVLDKNPNFCTDHRTRKDALSYCPKSCGLNIGAKKCTEPKNSRYTRISPYATIIAGDVMTFACKAGYFLTGGDTSRACGVNGVMLGSEPVCDDNPLILDVGLNYVRFRNSALDGKTAIVMDLPSYRVPINGAITKWFFNCKKHGKVYFLVFRKTGSDYKLIGHNEVTCYPWVTSELSVPGNNRTQVRTDDIVGVWSSSSTLGAHHCTDFSLRLMDVPTAKVTTFNDLVSQTKFSKIACIIPSFGYRVEKASRNMYYQMRVLSSRGRHIGQ